jgi:ribokinase
LGLLARVPEPESTQEVIAAAGKLETDATVVVTLGSEGALLVHGGEATMFPAPDVEPVDTTGAGDAFCGAIAEALCRDLSLEDSVRRGVAAGALATTTHGAQASLPTADRVERLLRA